MLKYKSLKDSPIIISAKIRAHSFNMTEANSKDSAAFQMQKGAKGDNLEDLFSTLKQQISSSDWLKENTAEKWVKENPELAKDYMDAAKKS
ncbi:hypothetical protein MAR_003070 [Mya arenaria]|uniref:Uncharacterized protein n=1 Tax=Mya arenaria TaxID=6604 RepID=A0ABY7G832_MYAAR|nr:hypothetical protein MAR_003070 [Mya arenaria]